MGAEFSWDRLVRSVVMWEDDVGRGTSLRSLSCPLGAKSVGSVSLFLVLTKALNCSIRLGHPIWRKDTLLYVQFGLST